MDLSFTRRRKGKAPVGTLDLQSLLSAAAARQSSSPTARAATATDDDARIVSEEDPRIGLFAAERQQPGAQCSASFAANVGKPVNSRERS